MLNDVDRRSRSSKTTLIGDSQIPAALGQTITGALANIPFPFGIDPNTGEYGYRKAGADAVIPFKSGGGTVILGSLVYASNAGSSASFNTSQYDFENNSYIIVAVAKYSDLTTYARWAIGSISKGVTGPVIGPGYQPFTYSYSNGVLHLSLGVSFQSWIGLASIDLE